MKLEEESIQDFTRRLGQAVQQVESYSMDGVLQNFRRSFRPSTLFFHSLSLEPLVTMEELYRWAANYSTLEDNICAATQTVMITNQSTEGNKLSGKKQSEPKEAQRKDRKRYCDQSHKKREPSQFTPLNVLYERLLPLIRDLLKYKWPVRSRRILPKETDPYSAIIIEIMGIRPTSVEV